MTPKSKLPFDPKLFLAKVGEGRTIAQYSKDQMVFSQGDPANAVFYIQKGKIKLTVVSNNGKEAVIAILDSGDFLGEGSSGEDSTVMVTVGPFDASPVFSVATPADLWPYWLPQPGRSSRALAFFGTAR
jgi:CRP-like cAMP-binding protein